MADQGKRSLDDGEETEEVTQTKKAKTEEMETPTEAAPGPPSGPPPAETPATAGPAMIAPAAAGQDGSKRGFAELPAAIQQMFTDCFQKLALTPESLDTSVYDSLCDFSEDIQNEIVSSFCRADLETIRNKTGYFIGILKQYRKKGKGLPQQASAYGGFGQQQQQQQQQQFGGYGQQYPGYGAPQPQQQQQQQQAYGQQYTPPPKPPGGHGLSSLPASVQTKFQGIFAQGIVSEGELDKSIYDSLMDFDEASQGSIVDRYATANLSTVRNKTGYFISILKMARQQRATGQSVSSSGQGAGAAAAFPPAGPPPGAPPQYDPYTAYYAAAAAAAQGGAMPPGYDPYAAYYAAAAAAQQQQGGAYGAPQQQAVQQQQAVPKGAGGLPPSFYKISVGAQGKLASLYNSFMLQQDDLEDCVFDSLADFPENEQVDMCESFSNANLVGVRNKTAFFIGILKRHRGSVR